MTDESKHDPAGPAFAPPPPGEHLAIERLAAYEADELAPREVEAIQDHLALCPACTRTLLDLQAFTALPADGEPTAEEAAAAQASWRAVRNRLAVPGIRGEERRAPAAQVAVPFRRPPLRFHPAVQALAAGLAALLLGLPIWLRATAPPVLERTLAVYLFGDDEAHRGGDPETPQTLVRGGPMPVVVLAIPAGPTYPSYRLELLSQRGEERRELAAALVRVARANGREGRYLLAEIPTRRAFYRDYRLRISGVPAARPEILAEYRVRFVTP